jgi:hypothetical protein
MSGEAILLTSPKHYRAPSVEEKKDESGSDSTAILLGNMPDLKNANNENHNASKNTATSVIKPLPNNGNQTKSKDCFAPARPQPSLADQWALELAQMPPQEQKKIQQSLFARRTKEQEAQRARDRDAAGLTSFRRLSFDFEPLEGDEVPRFGAKRAFCEHEEKKNNSQ